MCDAVVPLSVRRSRAIEFSIVSRASSRENHRAVGVVKNSARTRRVSVIFRRPVLPFPIPPPIPLLPLSRPFPPRYSSCGATSLRRVRVYATGGNLLCDASRFSRVFPSWIFTTFPGTGSSPSSTFTIVTAVRENSVKVVRRKAPELRRSWRKRKRRRGRRNRDTTAERAREGDQQRIHVTGDGGPRQNVSELLFFTLFALFERRALCEKKQFDAMWCNLN